MLRESIEKNYNPYNEPHEKRLDWLPEGQQIPKNDEIIYFVGCTASYREKEIARATIDILTAAEVNFGIMHPNEWCCGSPLMRTGQKDLAIELIKHNVEAIESLVKTIHDILKIHQPKLEYDEISSIGQTKLIALVNAITSGITPEESMKLLEEKRKEVIETEKKSQEETSD